MPPPQELSERVPPHNREAEASVLGAMIRDNSVIADVVNVVSVAGTFAHGASGPYAAAKHAQLAFSRSIGAELSLHGIRVHTINPGFVETEGFPQRTALRSRVFRRLVIEPDDVARHVLQVLDRDKRETFVPRVYRLAALVQALAPGLVARAGARSGYRTQAPRIGE